MSDSVSKIDLSVLPQTLCDRAQWVCWTTKERDGKQTKIPVTPNTGTFASSTNPDTWTDVETALEYVRNGAADGVGFVFTDDDPIVGVDLDDCLDPKTGDVDDDARDIIDRLDSYTEISPSGTGYHVLIEGDLPEGRNRRGGIELYDKARFFTVTGDHVDGTPTHIACRQDALVAIHGEYVAEEIREKQDNATKRVMVVTGSQSSTSLLEDADLLEKASNAQNGPKFERLWNGNTAGYDSNSEADMALCFLLAFWTSGDADQIDRLFRQSGLYREKWDDVHYADGSTYGEKTIDRAISGTSEFYDSGTGDEEESSPTPQSTQTSSRTEIKGNAYLTEKNQLLTERVTEQESTLEQKNKRIETLEAEIERLTDKLSGDDGGEGHLRRSQSDTQCEDKEAETTSLWSRTKQLFGSESE